MNPLKAIKAGTSDPIGQRINPDSRFYITENGGKKKRKSALSGSWNYTGVSQSRKWGLICRISKNILWLALLKFNGYICNIIIPSLARIDTTQ
jgi:hypothetical protein